MIDLLLINFYHFQFCVGSCSVSLKMRRILWKAKQQLHQSLYLMLLVIKLKTTLKGSMSSGIYLFPLSSLRGLYLFIHTHLLIHLSYYLNAHSLLNFLFNFRLCTTDGSEFLFLAPSSREMEDWVNKISFHARLPPSLQLMSYDENQKVI